MSIVARVDRRCLAICKGSTKSKSSNEAQKNGARNSPVHRLDGPSGLHLIRLEARSHLVPIYLLRTSVLDLVTGPLATIGLDTLAVGTLAGCRKAAWAAAKRAIGTRNGLQLT
jgi:hypothetical protein